MNAMTMITAAIQPENLSRTKSRELVDLYGRLKAQQAELAAAEKKLKAMIASRMDAGQVSALEGELFRVTRATTERSTLDADAVRKLLAEPPMKTTEVTSYRVAARRSQ